MREIITCYADSRRGGGGGGGREGGSGYPDLKKMQGPFSSRQGHFRMYLEVLFCSQLESEDTFYKNPYHAHGQIQQMPVHGTLNPGGQVEFLTPTSQSWRVAGGGGGGR